MSPALHGFNAGITFAGIHDSIVGWATLATPAIGYSFNDIWSVDATIPIYMYRLAESLSAHPRPSQLLVTRRGELGDLILESTPSSCQALPVPAQRRRHRTFRRRSLRSHHRAVHLRLQQSLRTLFRPLHSETSSLEIGDSSTLVNRHVNKNLHLARPLSHFQIGLAIDLFHGATFESDAYEQLPIGDQKIYGPSRNGKATVVTGHNVTEDNGFTNSLDIPFDRNFSSPATTVAVYDSLRHGRLRCHLRPAYLAARAR